MFTTMNACPKVTSASVTPRNRRMLIAVSISAWPLSLRVLPIPYSGSPLETQLAGMRPPRAEQALCPPNAGEIARPSVATLHRRGSDALWRDAGAAPRSSQPDAAPFVLLASAVRYPAAGARRFRRHGRRPPARQHECAGRRRTPSFPEGDGAPPPGAMLTPPPPAAIIARRDAHPSDLADALPA